jgi:hypothetical protein
MMFVHGLYLSLIIILLSCLTLTQAAQISPNITNIHLTSTVNMTINGNVTTIATSVKNRLDQSKDLIHDAFSKMDGGTLIRGIIVFAGITGLILMYIGIKTFL